MKSALFLTTAFGALCIAGVVSAAGVHTQIFTGSGTFTVPSNAKPAQEFQFTVVGGGGGGGGCDGTQGGVAGGGGSGGAGFVAFHGFNPSDTVTITIGPGGSGGTAGGGSGGGGGVSDTKLTYASTIIVDSAGGFPSLGSTGGLFTSPGNPGTFTVGVGSTGLTIDASLDYKAEEGLGPRAMVSTPLDLGTVPGGGNPIGHAGTVFNHNGVLGGGGLGCFSQNVAGGAGGSGVVIVTWVQ